MSSGASSSESPGHAGSGAKSEQPFLPRWAWWLIAPGLAMPVCIVAFMGVAQLAHDEQRCPFHEHGVQQLAGGASVIEEARQCMPGTEERRYRLRRGDQLQVLGERRLSRDSFAPDKFSWIASINERGEAQVVLHDKTHGDVLFREGTAAERAGGALQPLPAK